MDWHDQEALLWSEEMARSTRRFHEALSDGSFAAQSSGQSLLALRRAQVSERIATSQVLCAESRALCATSWQLYRRGLRR
jgi:hypothetical protein